MGKIVTVKIEGLSALGEAMKDLGSEVATKLSRQATRAAAKSILEAARARAPVKTGALRESIQIRRDTKRSKPGFEVVGVGVFKIKGWGTYTNNPRNRQMHRVGQKYDADPPTYYWKFIEFGTVKMSAKPFLRPAFDQEKSSSLVAMEETLAKGIDKQVAKSRKR